MYPSVHNFKSSLGLFDCAHFRIQTTIAGRNCASYIRSLGVYSPSKCGRIFQQQFAWNEESVKKKKNGRMTKNVEARRILRHIHDIHTEQTVNPTNLNLGSPSPLSISKFRMNGSRLFSGAVNFPNSHDSRIPQWSFSLPNFVVRSFFKNEAVFLAGGGGCPFKTDAAFIPFGFVFRLKSSVKNSMAAGLNLNAVFFSLSSCECADELQKNPLRKCPNK